MATHPDPNKDRKPGDPFIYKGQYVKLDPDDPALAQRLAMCGQHNMNQTETAATCGVHQTTLARFWTEHPQFREAWEHGRALRTAKLRVTLDRHAILDPSTARFLAKNELDMHDDPAKARLETEQTKVVSGGRQEIEGRIIELTAKLVGTSKVELPQRIAQSKGAEVVPKQRFVSRKTNAGGQSNGT